MQSGTWINVPFSLYCVLVWYTLCSRLWVVGYSRDIKRSLTLMDAVHSSEDGWLWCSVSSSGLHKLYHDAGRKRSIRRHRLCNVCHLLSPLTLVLLDLTYLLHSTHLNQAQILHCTYFIYTPELLYIYNIVRVPARSESRWSDWRDVTVRPSQTIHKTKQ